MAIVIRTSYSDTQKEMRNIMSNDTVREYVGYIAQIGVEPRTPGPCEVESVGRGAWETAWLISLKRTNEDEGRWANERLPVGRRSSGGMANAGMALPAI